MVTKIGMNAFGGLKYSYSSETWTTSLGIFKKNSPFPTKLQFDPNSEYLGTDSLTQIKLPDNISYIGYGAFMNELNPRCLKVNIPKNIKVIRTFAYKGCLYGDYVRLQEGVEEIGVAWDGEAMTLDLPASLKRINDFDDHNFISRDYLRFADITIHPDNASLKAGKGTVFSKDGSKLYPLSLNRSGEGADLTITKNLHVEMDSWYDIDAFMLPRSLALEDGCRNYALFHGVLFNHTLDTLILCPKNVDDIILPPTFKCLLTYHALDSCKSLFIPREVKSGIFWEILKECHNEDCVITYEAMDDSKTRKECMQLVVKEVNENPYIPDRQPLRHFYKLLLKADDTQHAEEIMDILLRIEDQRQ